MTDNLKQLKALLVHQQIPFTENEAMSSHTTFGVGGAATFFIEPSAEGQISLIQSTANELGIRLFCIGRGSNLLVPDSGLPFPVIHLGDEFSGIQQKGPTTLCVLSGTKLANLCSVAAGYNLTGLEFAYGIPGTVGGGIYMNAGAYGGELCSVIRTVSFLDDNGIRRKLTHDELDFGYRHSYFTGKNCIILSAEIELELGNNEEICRTMDDYMQRRRDKQPLEYGSAGSTFKRPYGAFAGALIEQCGLKGFTIGGAGISKKHAGFVVNTDHATASDVLAVINHVQTTVKNQTGYMLEPEIKILP